AVPAVDRRQSHRPPAAGHAAGYDRVERDITFAGLNSEVELSLGAEGTATDQVLPDTPCVSRALRVEAAVARVAFAVQPAGCDRPVHGAAGLVPVAAVG